MTKVSYNFDSNTKGLRVVWDQFLKECNCTADTQPSHHKVV